MKRKSKHAREASFRIQPQKYLWRICLSISVLNLLLSPSQAFVRVTNTNRALSTPRKATPDDKITAENNPSILLNLLSPSDACSVGRLSPTDLAYIGDVVYELMVRTKKVWPAKRTQDLQNQVVRLVRAEFQADLVAQLRQTSTLKDDHNSNFTLTSEEERILQRGRNAGSKTNHRKKGAAAAAYQDATALEALLGYLYISDRPRCTELLQWIEARLE